MKILKLTAANFKKIRVIEIQANGENVTLSGKNGSGKTSSMDSLWSILQYSKAAKKIDNPIRNGEDSAIAKVELGEYIITRKWTQKSSTVTVIDGQGNKVSSPQKILDDLVGELSFDPLEFSNMTPGKQTEALIALAAIDVTSFDEAHKNLYSERRDANKDVTTLAAAAKDLVKPDDDWPDEEVSVSDLALRLREMDAVDAAAKKQINDKAIAVDKETSLNEQIASLEAQLNAARNELAENASTLLSIVSNPLHISPKEERGYLESQISNTDELNKKARDKKLFISKKEEYFTARETAKQADISLKENATNRAAVIASANYPLPGLAIDPENMQLQYEGKSWTDLSTGEQLRVSTAMAMAMNPELRVIFLRNASLLDKDNLAVVTAAAAEQDYQVWIEVVESDEPTALRFVDGAIEGQDADDIVIEAPTQRRSTQVEFETVEDNPFEDA